MTPFLTFYEIIKIGCGFYGGIPDQQYQSIIYWFLKKIPRSWTAIRKLRLLVPEF